MSLTPREPAAIESYPTFWAQADAPRPPAAPVAVPPQRAYEAFVTWCEADFPVQSTNSNA
ncbi:hypothetical protein [Gemmata sp.]|uniref:hypothetical protein n=1 Tax=Gemmata sp. TaxID=1914242 RepID=UPI003F71FC16